VLELVAMNTTIGTRMQTWVHFGCLSGQYTTHHISCFRSFSVLG